MINAQEPAVDYRDRIVEAKEKLLKMIQKGIIFGRKNESFIFKFLFLFSKDIKKYHRLMCKLLVLWR